MARVKQDLRGDLVKAGLVDKVGAELIFPTLPTAVMAYLRAYEARHGALPPGVRAITRPATRRNPRRTYPRPDPDVGTPARRSYPGKGLTRRPASLLVGDFWPRPS
jgi:SulP family sulfate permease